MITIDGSLGEGGGQILRSSLALSMVTGQPFRIENVRANRRKPGLMRQHMTAAKASAEICGGSLEGAEIGSTELTFLPGTVQPGEYRFSIGTAGSATLVCQTILPALMLADKPSQVIFEGGTHNPAAPPFPFLQKSFLPVLEKMGVRASLRLERPGFYPAGGGCFVLEVQPFEGGQRLELMERGSELSRKAEAIVAGLPTEIAERELRVVRENLGWEENELILRGEKKDRGPGNVLVITIAFENLTETFVGFGEFGTSAERVAKKVLKGVQRYLKSDVAVGPHLADQLLLPMAIIRGGSFTTQRLSRHSATNIEIIQSFLDIAITTEETRPGAWIVQVEL